METATANSVPARKVVRTDSARGELVPFVAPVLKIKRKPSTRARLILFLAHLMPGARQFGPYSALTRPGATSWIHSPAKPNEFWLCAAGQSPAEAEGAIHGLCHKITDPSSKTGLKKLVGAWYSTKNDGARHGSSEWTIAFRFVIG